MPTSTSCGADLTRSTNEEPKTSEAAGEPIGPCLPRSHENLTACDSGEKLIESLPPDATDSAGLGSSSGSDRDVSDYPGVAMSKMTRNVVWIFLFDGDTIVFTCSGIPIERNQSYIRVLTSANLAEAMRGKEEPGSTMKSFQIEARDAFDNVAPGCLERCALYHGIDGASFVQVTGFLDVCEVNLSHGVEIRPHGDLVTMKLTVDSSGATPVKVIPIKVPMPSEGDEVLCKAGDGGPLFADHGEFVGMNIFSNNGRCVFVQKSVIVEQLERIKRARARQERYKCTNREGLRRSDDGLRTLEKRYRTKFAPY